MTNPCPNFHDAPDHIQEHYEYDPPSCSGKWIGGSGGHRIHERCNKLASWWHPDDCDAYCNEHIHERDAFMYMKLWEETWSK